MMDGKAAAVRDIRLKAPVSAVDSHPEQDIIALGITTGKVGLYSLEGDKWRLTNILRHHKKSCRALSFTLDGDKLLTASRDRTVAQVDVETSTVERTFPHRRPISTLSLVSEQLITSGDETGSVYLWDRRREDPIFRLKDCDDYISCLAAESTGRTLLATSGEGTLTAYNLRKHKLDLQSELFTCDMSAVVWVKQEKKVTVCGSDGAVNIFNAGEWGNISDRYPAANCAIDSMYPINDTLLSLGLEDGTIKVCHVHPNKCLLTLGQQKDGYPVLAQTITHDSRYLVTVSAGEMIHTWPLGDLVNLKLKEGEQKSKKTKEKLTQMKARGFYADMEDTPVTDEAAADDDEVESGDDEDDDEEDSNDEDSSVSDSGNDSD